MKKFQTTGFEIAAFVFVILYTLGIATFFGVVGYVAYHFIHKIW